MGIHLGPLFQTSLYFLETEDSIFKTLYKFYAFNIVENIQIRFFLYFNKYKILEL
jgi:hypothetical protein